MKKGYRIVVNNDVLKIIEDKIIKLTLLDREDGDVASELLVEVYTPKVAEGYDVPQFGLEPDFSEIIDCVFHYEDMVIWGVKDVSLEDEEPKYQVCWYFDKGELES